MYDLLANLLKEDYSVDVSKNQTYNQFFETNFVNTFLVVQTEDIKDLNKHLLDTQLDYYKNFVSKSTTIETIKEEPEEGNVVLYSIQRIINFKQSNRYSYRVHNKITNKNCQVEKVILPIEGNYIFSGPIIILTIDKTSIELHLRGTMKLGHREYGIYSPFYESTFTLSLGKIPIMLNNQLSTAFQGCDVYKIDSCKEGKLMMSYALEEFMIGDYIRVTNFSGVPIDDTTCLHKQYKVVDVSDNEITISDKKVSIKEGLYVMNVSVQHSIHVSYH